MKYVCIYNLLKRMILSITNSKRVYVCRLAPSVRSAYSEVSDSREMYNPSMTPGACMDPYMRPPHAPPPHGMMGHRGMPPPEGERSSSFIRRR